MDRKSGSWTFDFARKSFYATKEAYEIFGRSQGDFDGSIEQLSSFIIPEDRTRFEDAMTAAFKGITMDQTLSILTAEGTKRLIRTQAQIVFDQLQVPLMMLSTVTDITEQDDVELLKKQMTLMSEDYHDIFEILDCDGMIKFISPAVEKLFGLKKQDLENRYIWDLTSAENRDYLKTVFDRCVSNPLLEQHGKINSTGRTGDTIYLAFTMKNFLNDDHIRGIVIYWKNITASVNFGLQVDQLSKYDDVTELPNRKLFKSTLEEITRQAAETTDKFAVFMIDIENIKAVSSIISYDFGDELIKLISLAIKTSLVEHPIFIARFFGDQFGIIAEHISDNEEARVIADKIVAVFSESFILNGYEAFLEVNVGYAIFPDDARDSDKLIKFAHVALSRAVETDNISSQAYAPILDIRSFKEFTLRNDLKKAISNDELEVYYQPLVNLKTGEIIAAEALIRWNHPEWGLVSPAEFIPIAESSGLIIPIGKWILNEVCEHYKRLAQMGLKEIKISINYSAVQFYEANFAAEIIGTILQHQLNPKFMILEITESILINKSKQIDAEINQLKDNGIQIALDDFGTGYSSLTYLSAMDVDVLKLDRSFIESISKDKKSVKILVAIINLARDLELKLVAEGISEEGQLSFLRDNLCFSGQGYLFSKPLKFDDFALILEKAFILPASETLLPEVPEEEQRQSDRFNFDHFIDADITIKEINKRPVNVGQTKAQIRDIGVNGLSFITAIKFPVKNDIVLKFNFTLNEKPLELHGFILWSEDISAGKYLYGLGFCNEAVADESLKVILAELFDCDAKGKRIRTVFEELEASGKLPVISDDIKEILELLYDPAELDIEVLALKVSESTELNRLLMDNINSGYFKIAKKVSTIEEAIILIGIKAVQNLIVYFITKLIFDVSLERSTRKFDIHHYWRHVLGTSVAAQIISKKINKGDKYMLFTFGLVHDIGIPILDNCLPDKLDRIAAKVEKGTHQVLAEKIELKGLTHADVGAWICKKLRFREDITEIVKFHHTPLLSEKKSIDTMIMYVADVMSSQNNEKLLGLSSHYEVSEKVLENIGLSKKDYDAIAKTLSHEIEKVGTYFKL